MSLPACPEGSCPQQLKLSHQAPRPRLGFCELESASHLPNIHRQATLPCWPPTPYHREASSLTRLRACRPLLTMRMTLFLGGSIHLSAMCIAFHSIPLLFSLS